MDHGFITKIDLTADVFSDHIDIKVAELIVAAHALLVHVVEVLVAESAEEGGVIGDPNVVLTHPNCYAGLADVTVSRHLGSSRSEERVVLFALRVSWSHKSHINKGEQVLVVALVLIEVRITKTQVHLIKT